MDCLYEERLPYLPTPEQIREAAAKERESWTEAEHRERAGIRRTDWAPPNVSDPGFDP